MLKAISHRTIKKKKPQTIFEASNIFLTHKTKLDEFYCGSSKPRLMEIETIIIPFGEFDGENDNASVGYIAACKISGLKTTSHEDLSKACKSQGPNLSDAFLTAFKKAPKGVALKKHKDISIQMKDSFIYIDTVCIFNDHRGLGIGNIAVKRFIEDLGENAILFVKPYAFEDANSKVAHKKVQGFWKGFGFKEMSYSGFYTVNSSKVIR